MSPVKASGALLSDVTSSPSEQRAVVRQVDPGSGITGIHTRYWVVMYPGGYRFTATFDSAINFANDKIKELRA